MSIPYGLAPFAYMQVCNGDGTPISGAKLFTYASGSVTPLATYSTSISPYTANSNPVIADDEGRFSGIFMLPQAYKLILRNALDETILTADNISDIGQVYFANLGDEEAAGSKNQTSGYTVVASDNFVSISNASGADPAIINLQPSADRGFPLVVENRTAVDLAVTPNGVETIDAVSGAFTIPAAATPIFPKIVLVPTTSGYLIFASHGIV